MFFGLGLGLRSSWDRTWACLHASSDSRLRKGDKSFSCLWSKKLNIRGISERDFLCQENFTKKECKEAFRDRSLPVNFPLDLAHSCTSEPVCSTLAQILGLRQIFKWGTALSGPKTTEHKMSDKTKSEVARKRLRHESPMWVKPCLLFVFTQQFQNFAKRSSCPLSIECGTFCRKQISKTFPERHRTNFLKN